MRALVCVKRELIWWFGISNCGICVRGCRPGSRKVSRVDWLYGNLGHLDGLHHVEDGLGELVGGALAAHVTGAVLALGDNGVDGLGDAVGVVIETKVPQQHGTTEKHSSGVGLVLALDVETDVSAAGLEDGDLATHVAAGDDTGATDEGGANVGQDATVQIRHDHDVELLGAGDGLHGGVVDNHVVDLEGGVVLGGLVEGAAEQTVGELHDVGLVDAGDLAAAVGEGEGEGELGDALGLGAGDDLEGLDDAGDTLVLEAGVLTLGVLTDDAQVDVLVAGLVAGDVLDERDGGVDVELLAHGDVEALVAGAADGRVQDTLEAELVALEGGDGLAEGGLGAPAVLDTGDGDLLPLDGHVVGLEDGLDRLGHLATDTVTGDQADGVLAAKLGGLEDVGLDGGEAAGSDGLGSGAAEGLEVDDMLAFSFACSLALVLEDAFRAKWIASLVCQNHRPGLPSRSCIAKLQPTSVHPATRAGADTTDKPPGVTSNPIDTLKTRENPDPAPRKHLPLCNVPEPSGWILVTTWC